VRARRRVALARRHLGRGGTAALLPPSLREEYGLRWSRAHALPLALAARSLHVLAVPLLRTAGRISSPKLGYATS
jgi:hypothetical protein